MSLRKRLIMCQKSPPDRCIKEVKPGVFMGTAYVYEPFWLSCLLCKQLEEKSHGQKITNTQGLE